MKKNFLLSLLLIGPFLLMVATNEMVRPVIKEQPFVSGGITAINSRSVCKQKCTWHCSFDTRYCQQHHVKLLNNHLDSTDIIYYGVIKFLRNAGNYHVTNLIFLVVVFPLIIWLLIGAIIQMQFKITKLKRAK